VHKASTKNLSLQGYRDIERASPHCERRSKETKLSRGLLLTDPKSSVKVEGSKDEGAQKEKSRDALLNKKNVILDQRESTASKRYHN